MTHSSHRIVKCVDCENVIEQCRCPSPSKPVVRDGRLCQTCQANRLTAQTMAVSHLQQARYYTDGIKERLDAYKRDAGHDITGQIRTELNEVYRALDEILLHLES